MIIRVKNMVCPRCIMVVENLLTDLHLQPRLVALGEAELAIDELKPSQKTDLHLRLQQVGFELLEDAATVTTEQIKNLVITHIHHTENNNANTNWSHLLAQHLHRDYSHLSKLFSETEGITIEQYIIRQKIERVKELLLNDEFNLSQIAFNMNYSSTAHLSTQFKKVTGLTPSQYKQQAKPQRQVLDSI